MTDIQKMGGSFSPPPMEEDRAILILDVIDGYRSDEIGRMLNLNPNTVRSRKQRAMVKLRRLLGEEHDD